MGGFVYLCAWVSGILTESLGSLPGIALSNSTFIWGEIHTGRRDTGVVKMSIWVKWTDWLLEYVFTLSPFRGPRLLAMRHLPQIILDNNSDNTLSFLGMP